MYTTQQTSDWLLDFHQVLSTKKTMKKHLEEHYFYFSFVKHNEKLKPVFQMFRISWEIYILRIALDGSSHCMWPEFFPDLSHISGLKLAFPQMLGVLMTESLQLNSSSPTIPILFWLVRVTLPKTIPRPGCNLHPMSTPLRQLEKHKRGISTQEIPCEISWGLCCEGSTGQLFILLNLAPLFNLPLSPLIPHQVDP